MTDQPRMPPATPPGIKETIVRMPGRPCRRQADMTGQQFPLEPNREQPARHAEEPPGQGLAAEFVGRGPLLRAPRSALLLAAPCVLLGLEQSARPATGSW